MASSSKIRIIATEQPIYAVPNLSTASADMVNLLLQENHENHHIFFKASGFHNHTVHHILSLYAIGASPSDIERQYNDHKKAQRHLGVLDPNVVNSMHDPQQFKKYLANEQHYHNFLEFFRREIAVKGCEAVVLQYLLSKTEQADDLLTRCFAGFLHPLIHLGFALEFMQPAIVAEALAQAALHRDYLAPFYLGAEKAASKPTTSSSSPSKPLQLLLKEISMNEKLATAAEWNDDNKIRDGILVRAPQEMIDAASQWSVTPEELEFRNAEMVNAVVSYTIGAQSPPKQVKFDFYFMHCVNCSIFFSSLLKLPWIPPEDKCRILEWKGRTDLVMYASRRAPQILEDEWEQYKPRKPGTWETLFARVAALAEDGHACKMLRALAHGEELCRRFSDRPELRIKSGTWLNLGHMLMDSVEDTGKTWVRSAGFAEAWEGFNNRVP